MSDPVAVMLAIDAGAVRLDELEQLMGQAVAMLEDAESDWLEIYDRVAESLKTEMADEGRKGDPAEHWITTQARRENRVAYADWRRARRAVEMIERQIGAVKAAMNGRQSELAALRDETIPRTDPHTGEVIGGRRAA